LVFLRQFSKMNVSEKSLKAYFTRFGRRLAVMFCGFQRQKLKEARFMFRSLEPNTVCLRPVNFFNSHRGAATLQLNDVATLELMIGHWNSIIFSPPPPPCVPKVAGSNRHTQVALIQMGSAGPPVRRSGMTPGQPARTRLNGIPSPARAIHCSTNAAETIRFENSGAGRIKARKDNPTACSPSRQNMLSGIPRARLPSR
jgi:hypothetical protein